MSIIPRTHNYSETSISKNVIGYKQEQSTYCDPQMVSYSSVAKATEACGLDTQCGGFFENCGNGNDVKTCGLPLIKRASSCGSRLHEKTGKILIQLDTMIS